MAQHVVTAASLDEGHPHGQRRRVVDLQPGAKLLQRIEVPNVSGFHGGPDGVTGGLARRSATLRPRQSRASETDSAGRQRLLGTGPREAIPPKTSVAATARHAGLAPPPFSGAPGPGKSSIGVKFADAACHLGAHALFFAYEESSEQSTRNMRAIGIDLAPATRRRPSAPCSVWICWRRYAHTLPPRNRWWPP